MKAVQNLITAFVVFAVLGVCTTGFLHNIYLVASEPTSLFTILRAIGIFLFPIGILLGLI